MGASYALTCRTAFSRGDPQMTSQFTVPAIMVLIAIAVAIVADIRQFKIFNVLILPWVMVGLVCYFPTGGDVALRTALQSAAVPALLTVALILAVSIQLVHALGRRH